MQPKTTLEHDLGALPYPILDFQKQLLRKWQRDKRQPMVIELADYCGVSRQTIYSYSRNLIRAPRWSIVIKIAEWLGCGLHELVVNLNEVQAAQVLRLYQAEQAEEQGV